MFLSKKQKTVFAVSLFICSNLFSQTNNETSNETTELSAIEVKASINPTGGGNLLDNKKVTFTPTPTNSITDTLRTNSNIQFSSNSRSSAQGGEITPPKVSIRGSQHYESSFLINGVDNNNRLNPSGGTSVIPDSAPTGETQSLFLDTSLVDTITTYTENIGVEYGGFTGGVVDVKLKDAHTDRWHFMAKYRYTTDSLAKYHLTDEQKNINQSTDADYQPEFNKYEYTFSADGPINDNFGLMLSYGKQHSKIPLWSEYNILKPDGNFSHKEKRTEYRNNENYLIRLNTHNIDDLEASLTMIYAPYTESRFTPYAKNADYDKKGGGLNIAYDMKNILSFGLLKNTIAYKQDETSINAASVWHKWNSVPAGYANWDYYGYAYRGSGGDRELKSKSLIYKGILEIDEFNTGELEHNIKAGIETEFGKARYIREKTHQFRDPESNTSVSGNKEDGIITGEQFAATDRVRFAIDNKQSYTSAALFLEDTINIDRYTIRPGLRFSTDTVTNNKDIAPRLFVNANIFDDKTLNVYGGYNRYYGSLILYNAIYEYHEGEYKRSAYNQPWIYDNSSTTHQTYSLNGIKTPYSDEFSIGSSLRKWDTDFKLDFVKRAHKDQLKQKSSGTTAAREYFTTNEGKSSYWGITFSASKEYQFKNSKHFSELSITNSKATTNLNGLNSFVSDDGYSGTHITYDGKLTRYEDVPSSAYNAPWIITYSHITEINDSLHLGLNARYEKGVDGYRWVSDGGGLKDPDGINTRVYESKHYKDTFTVDLTANYDLKIRGNKLTFGLEVLNLLNRKNDATYATTKTFGDGYAMGRQFYANFRYEY